MTKGRVEVITSVERRRRWSSAEKQQLVSASLEPGASVSVVAREAGIHPGQLYGWRRQLGVRPRIGFTPVRIAPEAAPAILAESGAIEIDFATGARMRITGAVDAAALTAAVAVLAEGRRR
jgi:transposase